MGEEPSPADWGRNCAEARARKGFRIVLLDEGDHLFAHDAAEIELPAGVGCAEQAADFHGVLGKVGDLKGARLVCPTGTILGARAEIPDAVLPQERSNRHRGMRCRAGQRWSESNSGMGFR